MIRGIKLWLMCVLVMSAALGHAQSGRVLGNLGQSKEQAKIHASPSSRSRVFYAVKPFEYLVVNKGPNSTWTRVLMSNGVNGYIKTEAVAVLPYTVSPKQAQSRTSTRGGPDLTSRGMMANYALKFTGTPYKWGGNDINNGIDCSGFVQKLYGGIGMDLPRTAAEQARVGLQINNLEDLVAGDRLYFWDKKRGKIGHTGIYLGNGYFVHSSSGHKGVATDYLGAPKWRRILVAARR